MARVLGTPSNNAAANIAASAAKLRSISSTQTGVTSTLAAAVAEALDLIQLVVARNERRVNDATTALTNDNAKDSPVKVHTSRLIGGLQVQSGLDGNVRGQGAELIFSSQTGTLQAYDHNTGTYLDLNIKGKNVTISSSGTATFAAHATQHQNGGSDEVATGTPAANAIPKAGAGGTLAAGWMPAFTGDTTTTAGTVATTVGKLQGRTVASTAPTDGQYLAWDNGGSQWKPTSPGAWQSASLVNSWANTNTSTYNPAQYRLEGVNIVRLSGNIKSGASATTAFTLASGYRPPKTVIFSAWNDGANAESYVSVDSSGNVVPSSFGAIGNVSLEGMTFSTV